MIVRKFSVEN